MLAALTIAATLGVAVVEDVGVVFRSTTGVNDVLAACPRVAVVEASTGTGELVRTLLATCSGSEPVVQLPPSIETPPVTSLDDARFRALSYWTLVAPTALSPLFPVTPGERARIWVAGPPNFDSIPSWRTDPACDAAAALCATDYVGAFWAELDRLARLDGFRGLVLPPFSQQPADRPTALCDLLAGIDRQTLADVAWNYDAVSPGLSRTVAEELTTTFGYRQLRATCASARVHPLLVRVSTLGGWQSRTTAAGFVDWLRFIDGEVDSDAEPFLGLALYGLGTNDSNDLTPFSAELAAYLVDPSSSPDTGGGGSGGTDSPAAPPTEPGSNLGPDSGPSFGCSTTGAGSLALLAIAPFALRRRRPTAQSAGVNR